MLTDERTVEATAYLQALYVEFREQVARYRDLTAHRLELEAEVELAERTLCVTRDHLAMVIARGDSAMPCDWKKTFCSVRFVGWRLANACVALLRKYKKLTPEQLLHILNLGMFRFRTNTPRREIHAALLRQQFAKREGDGWIWTGPAEEQTQGRLTNGSCWAAG